MTKDPQQKYRSGCSSAGGTQAKPETPVTGPYWQSFPRMERLLAEERPAVLAQMEATCRLLDATLKSGSRQEAARAQAAMNAYGRTLELYRTLAMLRDNSWAASNKAVAARDK